MSKLNPWDNWRPEVEGWSSDILPFYEACAAALPPVAIVVEVGVYLGRSVLYLAEAMVRHRKTGTIWAVDTWDATWRPAMWLEFNENLNRTTGEARRLIEPMRAPSVTAAAYFDGPIIDMLFVDGDHGYESVRDDLEAWVPRCKSGAIIAGHDYDGSEYGSFPGVDRAVHERFGKDRVLSLGGSVWRVKP